MFVQFGEKLRNKRFDPNNLKNTLFGLLEVQIDCYESKNKTFLVFVKFGENLRNKRFDRNDLKFTFFGLVKA